MRIVIILGLNKLVDGRKWGGGGAEGDWRWWEKWRRRKKKIMERERRRKWRKGEMEEKQIKWGGGIYSVEFYVTFIKKQYSVGFFEHFFPFHHIFVLVFKLILILHVTWVWCVIHVRASEEHTTLKVFKIFVLIELRCLDETLE